MILVLMRILIDRLRIELEIVNQSIYALSMCALSLFKVTSFMGRKRKKLSPGM
jgi:hypothetical protein